MSQQWLPEVYLTIPGSAWPAEPDLPVGTGRVHDFTVEREIVAARMPSQVRARTGFSIGSATCAIRQAEGRPLAPWAHADRRVTAGQPCELYALDEATGERNDLGAWQVHAPAGSLVRGDVGIELYESQYAGRLADPRLPVVAGPVDAAWVVDALARQAGFYSTPKPNGGAVLSVPLAGSLTPEIGSLSAGSQAAATWSTQLGQIGVANDPATRMAWDFTRTVEGSLRLAVTTAGAAFRFWLPSSSTALVPVDVIAWAHDTLSIRISDGAWTSVPWTPGRHPDHPLRQEFELEQSGTTIRARVRSTDSDTAWSAWASVPRGDATLTVSGVTIQWQATQVAGLQVGTGPMPWDAPTARIGLLDALVDAPWLPEAPDVWTGLQQVCDSFAAAGWVSKDRVLTVRNRHELAGSARPKTLVDVGVRVEDLPWAVNADDYADRLEVTWWPVTWGDEFSGDFELAGVGERLRVPAGRTVTVEVDLGQYVGTLYGWQNVSSTSADPFSEWQANTALDGSGAEVTSGITVSTEHLSPSAARVTVTNSGTSDVWMVDFDGAPGMILRGTGVVSQEAEQTITFGADAVDARQPLTVDLGKIVQRRATAEAIAAYLWERVNRPRYRINGVRMPLDWSRDLGDILTLTHPESDLTANVLVVADRKRGSSDAIEHRCDLIVLPPTWDDFDSVWAGGTWTGGFDLAWVGRSWTAFDTDPTDTEA